MSKAKKSHVIKLQGIKPDEIDKQYGFKVTVNSAPLAEKSIPTQSTKITELQNFNQNITYTDELKNTHNAKVSTVFEIQQHTKKLNCFWDKHPITSDKYVQCPIEKIHKPLIKNYISHINNKPYKIQDFMQESKTQEFNSDGAFCSTECCLAFIEDNKHDPIYQNSEYYLSEIYAFTEQKKAPHWRLLIPYGGNMTIEEFRKSFSNTIYTPDGVVFNPIFLVYRENYHL
jgi:hypothetical protein